MRNVGVALALCAAGLAPARTLAHEVAHDVVYGRAVAVRAYYAGGGPLAYAEYQVFSPTDPKIPWQKGRTDRDGWLAFVPGETGTWRVQVADRSGHGMILSVAARQPPGGPERTEGTFPWVLRLFAAVAAIGLVFAVLAVVQRRRRSAA